MFKPLVLELTQPLQQPLCLEAPEEPAEERAWEPSVRVVVFDDSPSLAHMPRDLEYRTT